MEMKSRFRGFMPVVLDVETGGLDPKSDALLEVAIVLLDIQDGKLVIAEEISTHIEAAPGTNICKEALAINKIIPDHPFRGALSEKEGLELLFKPIRQAQKMHDCKRSVLVAHNAWFDHQFINAAVERSGVKRCPFHPFTSFDTATLGGVMLGETILAKMMVKAGIEFKESEAHSAVYDARKTAELFCYLVNKTEIV